jgi:hypothetical protein
MKELKHRGKTYHDIPSQHRSSKLPGRLDILADMEKIFQLAMAAGKLSVALKAKELIGKEMGLFLPPSQRAKIKLNELSDEELMEALEEAEQEKINVAEQQQTIVQENVLLQAKLDCQKELYAEKHLQRERENQEFEDKRRKAYGPPANAVMPQA